MGDRKLECHLLLFGFATGRARVFGGGPLNLSPGTDGKFGPLDLLMSGLCQVL